MTADPQVHDFGDMAEPFELTTEQVVDYLTLLLCPAGEPHVGPAIVAGSDHGHTMCLMVGQAIRWLRDGAPSREQNRRLRAEVAGRKEHLHVLADLLSEAYSERDRARNTYRELKRQAAESYMRWLAAEKALRALEQWDMLSLTPDGHGAAAADAPWARRLIADALAPPKDEPAAPPPPSCDWCDVQGHTINNCPEWAIPDGELVGDDELPDTEGAP